MDKIILFFDIETKANPDCEKYIKVEAPSNYKDPTKIAEYIEEKRKAAIDAMALDPDYAQIAAISYLPLPISTQVTTLVVNETMTERIALSDFWAALAGCDGRSCGYNIIGFDFPFILRRSFALGIKLNSIPNLAKYQIEPTTDLMGILYNWGQAKGLKKVCDMYGIPNPLPDLDGSQVASMDAETLAKYSANDVNLTVALYQRMLGIYIPVYPAINRKRSFREIGPTENKPKKAKKGKNVSIATQDELPF